MVFLAPTKPLVAQQISACYDIMGVPERDTAELQGSVAPEKRRKLWDERRVFFCTPQSMANDIKKKRCDPARFVCVVVDEVREANMPVDGVVMARRGLFSGRGPSNVPVE